MNSLHSFQPGTNQQTNFFSPPARSTPFNFFLGFLFGLVLLIVGIALWPQADAAVSTPLMVIGSILFIVSTLLLLNYRRHKNIPPEKFLFWPPREEYVLI